MFINFFHLFFSLWGALRYKNPLPWDYDFDFGIIHADLTKVREENIFKAFESNGIKIIYRPYAGNYRVSKGGAEGDLMIFRNNNGVMQRVGFESYLLFVHYRKFHSFPANLVEKPLPGLEFAGENISAPHRGIELQKYLYPTSWWKVVKPDDNACR